MQLKKAQVLLHRYFCVHMTSGVTMCALFPQGPQRRADWTFMGEKIATTLVPDAAAMCIGPVLGPIKSDAPAYRGGRVFRETLLMRREESKFFLKYSKICLSPGPKVIKTGRALEKCRASFK